MQKNTKFFNFNSAADVGISLTSRTSEEVKNEPMLFSADVKFAIENGGPITREFIASLHSNFVTPNMVIDSRVHMLMPGWWPAIPGFHHDDVPRDRSDGQPDYDNLAYKAKHAMALVGDDCCPTEFALSVHRSNYFPNVPLGGTIYKEWHPWVEKKIRYGSMQSWIAPMHQMIYFDWQTFHQGTRATKTGWRFFIRATVDSKRLIKNEIRRQVQVYLEHPMNGW